MTATKTELTGVLVQIKGIRSSLNSAERKIADFILENPGDVESATVAKVASLSGVSEATVIRFSRTLGFDGFQELKMRLVRELYNPTVKLDSEEVKDNDSATEVIGKVFAFNIQILQETLDVLDSDAVEDAASIIGNAGKVLVVGVGTSAANVQDAHNKLFRLGINSVAQSDAHLQLMEAALLSSGDAVLAISHSGRTVDPIQTLQAAKDAGAKTIVITGNPMSPITKFSDIVLTTSSSENRFRSEALATRTAQMSIVDAIYTLISIKHKKRAVGAAKRIESVIGKKQILEKR